MMIKTILILTVLGAPILAPAAVTEESTWKETYTVTTASPRLVVRNIWGSVRVQTGAGGEITVSATELRSAPDRRRIELSRDVMSLEIDADANGVSLVVGDRDERWQRLNTCDGCRVDYQFAITVPPGTVLDVGTVLDGRVDIDGVSGMISASNVNGPVTIVGLTDCDEIQSVNGRIRLRYSRAPVQNCSIETINGDITLDVPTGTGLDMALDLFNGDIQSDFAVAAFSLPATVERVTDGGHKRYRIQQLSGIRIGAGGPVYSIASMNGDVRIQEHQ